jgi:CHAT domain-containing protein
MGGDGVLVGLAVHFGSTPAWQSREWKAAGAALCPGHSRIAEWMTHRRSQGSLLRVSAYRGDRNDKMLAEYRLGFIPRDVKFSPEGERLLVIGRSESMPGVPPVVRVLAAPGEYDELDRQGFRALATGEMLDSDFVIFAGAWLDDQTVLLAGRSGYRHWTARLKVADGLAVTRVDPVDSHSFPDDHGGTGWAACAVTGRAVFVCQDGIDVVDPSSPTVVWRRSLWHGSPPSAMWLAPDGERFVYATGIGSPKVVHVKTDTPVRGLRFPKWDTHPRGRTQRVVLAGEMIIVSDDSAIWAFCETDHGYRCCAPPDALEGQIRDLREHDGRFFLANTPFHGDATIIYEIVEPAVQVLAGGTVEDREWAAPRLAERCSPASAKALTSIAGSSDEATALLAIRTLGRLRTLPSVLGLALIVGEAAHAARRQAIADAADGVSPDDVVSALWASVAFDSTAGIQGAVWLSHRSVPGAVPRVIPFLAFDDPEIRKAARPGFLLDDSSGGGLAVAITDALERGQCAARDVLNAMEELKQDGGDGTQLALAITGRLAARRLGAPGKGASFLADNAALATLAAELAHTAGDPGQRWRMEALRGDYERVMAMRRRTTDRFPGLRRALRHYRDAMDIIDMMWRDLLDEDVLRGFFADKAALYDNAMFCSLRLGHVAEAYETLEKAKTRYLGDLIARRHADPVRRLGRISQLFWRAIDSAGGPAPLATDQFISGLASPGRTRVAAGPEDVLPERFAALVVATREGLPNSLWASVNVAQVWRYAAVAARYTGDLRPLPDDARTYLNEVRTALANLRDALRGTEDADMAASAFGVAARNPPSVPEAEFIDEFDRRPFGYPEISTPLRSAATANPSLATATVDALLEVTDYITGSLTCAVPVTNEAIPHPEAVLPRITASELGQYASTHWDEIARIARGETAGTAEATRMLEKEPSGTALIQFAITSEGTYVFVAADGGALTYPMTCQLYPAVTRERLLERLYGRSGWLGLYQRAMRHPSLRPAMTGWEQATSDLAVWLYTNLFQPTLPWLKAQGIRRLVVIPHRGLHLTPISGWHPAGRHGRYVIDDFEVCYAPSMTIREVCRRRRDYSKGASRLVAVAGGASLSLTTIRMAHRTLHPDNYIPLSGPNADQEHWSGSSPEATQTHYSGHAEYLPDEGDPLSSCLQLTDGNLTLGDLFDGAVPLPRSRITALCACETTMTDPGDPADEFLGISAGFIFGGSPVVLSTVWSVDATATLLLSARFYRELPGRRPGEALRRAQRWLRDLSNHAIAAELRRILASEQNPRERTALKGALATCRGRGPFTKPYQHPVYWAAFTVAGIDEPISLLTLAGN